MQIPSNRIWTQTNEGEISGVLNSTHNMALETVGQAKLAKRPVALLSSETESDFKYTMAIVYFDGEYQAVTSDKIFNGALDGSEWTEETEFTPSTTLASDAIVFKDTVTTQLIVTTATNFAKWDGATTTDYALGTLTDDVPHPLAIFDSLPDHKLAIGNGNQVNTYNNSYAINDTILTLPTQFIVTSLRYRNGYLYIGTKTTDGSEARIFIWNGSGTNAQYEVPVGAEWIYSMTEYGSSVAAITSKGQLIQVSGSQFTVLASLPVAHTPHVRWQGSGGLTLNGKVFNQGMQSVGNNIYINIEGWTDTGYLPNQKSGLWVYDPEAGLYHRATPNTDTLVRDASLSVVSNTITTSANHNLTTGDGVFFGSVSGLTGLDNDKTYYVTVESATEIKLSLSRKALANSRYVEIGGTADVGDRLIYYPNIDNGYLLNATSGAVALTSINETQDSFLSSEVIWGNRTNDESGATTYVLSAFADMNHRGSFTTQRIYAPEIEQTWKDVYTFLDGIITATDTAIVKLQSKYQEAPIELRGVWLSENELNTNPSGEDYGAWGDIEEGDEIVFTDGKGQGKTAHVVSISSSATVYTLTLDESFGIANESVRFYSTNFQKLGAYSADTKTKEYIKAAIVEPKPSQWVKIKVEIVGANVAVNSIQLPNNAHKGT